MFFPGKYSNFKRFQIIISVSYSRRTCKFYLYFITKKEIVNGLNCKHFEPNLTHSLKELLSQKKIFSNSSCNQLQPLNTAK